MSATYGNAVTREAAWFTTDTLPSYPGVAPLSTANGGPFDVIQAYRPTVNRKGRVPSLFITRESSGTASEENRIAMGGQKEWVHHFVAVISWPFRQGTTGKLEDEMQALDNAVAAVLERIRGPLGDKTHGAQFLSVGEDEGDIRVTYTDAVRDMTDREPLEAEIHYSALDTFTA